MRICAALALAAFAPVAAVAQEPAPSAIQRHAQLAGGKVAFTVSAGRLPIRDMETAVVRGRMFYTAFTRGTTPDPRRPVLFVWGGGPSAPSLGMQLVYGPRTISPDGAIVDNPNSQLAVADLVFVDPIGTGFSRAEKPEHVGEFYGTTGDARSVAEFIRMWLALNDRERSPLFLTGQSYGVWRAAIVAELLERSGRRVAGAILTSGGMGLADEFITRPLDIAMRVPDYAATALHHRRLPADLAGDVEAVRAAAERWATERYAPALARIETLTAAERDAVATYLARYTGYPLDKIDRARLTFTPREYLNDFPGEQGRRLNTFDMRLIDGGERRPADAAADARRARAQSEYLRGFVGYRTDLAYLGVEDGYVPVTSPAYRDIGSRWQWDSAEKGQEAAALRSAQAGEGPPGKQAWIARALRLNPALRVFVETGVYDSLNYCRANAVRLQSMPADLADNFVLGCYYAGHGTFRDPTVNPIVMRDIQAFIAAGGHR